MSAEKRIDTETFTAAVDLSLKQYFLMKQDASGNAVLAAAGTDKIEGNIVEPALSGAPVTVQTIGIMKVIAGGTIAINDRVTSDANGKAITTTTGGDYSIGRARTAAVAGDYVEVFIERWKV